MKTIFHITLGLVALYLLWAVFDWVRYQPETIDRELQTRVRLGMNASEVSGVLGTKRAFDVPPRAYCTPKSPAVVRRISVYTPGGVWMFLATIPTSTTFCYDESDKLLAFRTARWIDAL